MTNRKKLAKMSDRELAVKLCGMQKRCSYCCVNKLCDWGQQKNGWKKWLEAEAGEEDEQCEQCGEV